MTGARRAELAARLAQEPERPEWSDNTYILFSKDNERNHKNLRSYFDRFRNTYDYKEMTPRPPLRPNWQLNTPTFDEPWDGPIKVRARLERVASTPELGNSPRPSRLPTLDWHQRHSVMFSKDNQHYHQHLRQYFDVPKKLMI